MGRDRMYEPPTGAEMDADLASEAPAHRQADILDQIVAERERQDGLWGDSFDDRNTLNDWCAYLMIYAARAAGMENVGKVAEQRLALLKVASLAVAAIETLDRNGKFAARHYDPEREGMRLA